MEAGLHHRPAGYLGAVRGAFRLGAAAASVPTCGPRAAACGALSCVTGTCRAGKLTAECVCPSAGTRVTDRAAAAATCLSVALSLCEQPAAFLSKLLRSCGARRRAASAALSAQTWSRTSEGNPASVCWFWEDFP